MDSFKTKNDALTLCEDHAEATCNNLNVSHVESTEFDLNVHFAVCLVIVQHGQTFCNDIPSTLKLNKVCISKLIQVLISNSPLGDLFNRYL